MLQLHLLSLFLFSCLPTLVCAVDYVLIGVSGGLQVGFPAHSKLHYRNEDSGETVQALFLGRGLVRGYKAFLDLMEPGWREYSDNDNAVINPNVFASGCYEHANEYWLYLVDARQVISVLNNEPRFLSLTPDTGKVELLSNSTFPLVKEFLTTTIEQRTTKSKAKTIERVAIPLVTAVHFQPTSHIPSPPIYTLSEEDGSTSTTQVTNFPDSLAKWAGVNDSDRTAILECQQTSCRDQAKEAFDRYWVGIRKAIAKAKANRPTKELAKTYGPPFDCQRRVKFGVGPETPENQDTRINQPFTQAQVEGILRKIGYRPDYASGEIVVVEDVVPDL